MSALIVQAQYEELEQIAARFAAAAEQQQALQERVNRQVEVLRAGSWQGKGVAAFLHEMDGEVRPAGQRLIGALGETAQATLEIKATLRNAEEIAAAIFKGRGTPSDSMTASTIPPRIYIINGINSDGNVFGRIGDKNSVNLESLIERHGYDPNEVKSTPAIYLKPIQGKVNLQGTSISGSNISGTELSGTNITGTRLGGWLTPVDWATGKMASGLNAISEASAHGVNTITAAGASGINYTSAVGADALNAFTGSVADGISGGANTVFDGINKGYGVTQVIEEHLQVQQGRFTQSTYDYIQYDLENNPLLPGQSVMFVMHSGGGAVGDNLVGMLERDGYNVSGVATVESPIFDSSVANSYLENGVVRIYHRDDPVVPSLLRAILWDRTDKTIELNQAISDPHSGPMNSEETVEELNRSFPEMQLDM